MKFFIFSAEHVQACKLIFCKKKIKLTEVLIISDKGKPIIGDPLIKGASVEAEIVDHARNAKVTVFKKKRRHNYRRKKGHRQNITNIKILSINSKASKSVKSAAEEKKGTPKTTAKKTAVKKTAKNSKKSDDSSKKNDKKSKLEPKKTSKGSKE